MTEYLNQLTNLADTDQAPPRASDGFIPLKRRTLGDILTPEINGNVYVFTTRANIAMAWVAPADVASVLQIRCGCCNHKGICFTYANVADTRRWTIGGGR